MIKKKYFHLLVNHFFFLTVHVFQQEIKSQIKKIRKKVKT